jgi:formylglycine-generating enzyme required for sulfatase activity
VLFGGYSPLAPGVGAMNDTWEYDGVNWTQRTPSNSPPRRLSTSMVYDVARGRIVLFGGYEYPATFYSDTWEWDGANWAQRATTNAPSPRRGMMMAYDESRNATVAFGGGDGTQLYGDTWTYDGTNWTQRFPATSPSARWSSSFAYDGSCGAVTLFGGTNTLFAVLYNDVWEWDGANWVQGLSSGMSNRHGLAMDYDPASRRLVGFGGAIPGAQISNETWQRNGGCDRTMSVVNPPILGTNSSFHYRYPANAGLRLGFHFVSSSFAGAVGIQVPGYSSVGFARVDMSHILLANLAFLDGSGTNALTVAIPSNSSFLGLDFDVQSLDIDFAQNRIYWAANDAEVEVSQPMPPSALNLAPIAPGSFVMGSAAIGGLSAPAHSVTITQPFWMGRFEVTQADYQAVMGSNPSIFVGASRPVESVSRAQAIAYCAALNSTYAGQLPSGYMFRLPTEAEWEYCCRAGTSTEWNTGATAPGCSIANVGISFFQICVGQTVSVGSYAPNAWGLHDMHGNVGEWVLDKYSTSFAYPSNSVVDPYSPSGTITFYRGGSYNAYGFATASAARALNPFLAFAGNGFRICLAPVLPIQP